MSHDIEAYLDDTLDPEARAAFEAELARDPALRDTVAAARRVRDDLSWLAVEKGVQAGEQAFWDKQNDWRFRYRRLWPLLGLILLLVAGIVAWKLGKKPESVVPEQEKPQPGIQNDFPSAPDTSIHSTPATPRSPGDPKKQANKVTDGNRLFAANFRPYKDETLEPSRRGATTPTPSERFQQLYWEDKHREALTAFETLGTADQNNDNLLFLKANCLLATSRAEEATTLLEQILRNDRTRFMAEARWYLALSYLRSGRAEQSQNLLRGIASDDASPRQADAKRLLGQW
ncbi:MAG: hypothetical protein EPGJADBJ_00888 [Saprospiraceae bacterium]|nr:hypothetical protein [Saprospiraceae bacterium]